MKGLITIADACDLLGVSRPTLNGYRSKHRIREVRHKGRTLLYKIDLINKVMLPNPIEANLDFTLFGEFDFREIEPITGVFDLRKFSKIDTYGVVTLLCSIKNFLKNNLQETAYLIVDDSQGCSYLDSIEFFNVVLKGSDERVVINNNDLVKRNVLRSTIILPLYLVGYRGAEKKLLEPLYDQLMIQGFSEEYVGYIGWLIGELCDNAHTHSGNACFFVIEAINEGSTNTRFLSISLGDVGIGIQESLQKNPKYKNIEKHKLFAKAFKAEVSSMEVEPKRGKGLNDTISIAKGNKSWLRVDSNEYSLMFDFKHEDVVKLIKPALVTNGTRFSFVLIDSDFQKVTREEVDQVMNKFLEDL